jgi:hypothetical protein
MVGTQVKIKNLFWDSKHGILRRWVIGAFVLVFAYGVASSLTEDNPTVRWVTLFVHGVLVGYYSWVFLRYNKIVQMLDEDRAERQSRNYTV